MDTLSIVLGIAGIGACGWVFVKKFVLKEIRKWRRERERSSLSRDIEKERLKGGK